MTDQPPASSEQPTQPYLPVPTPEPPVEDQPDNADRQEAPVVEPASESESELPTDTAAEPNAEAFNQAAPEPPVSEPVPFRHPTGDPALTGGWYTVTEPSVSAPAPDEQPAAGAIAEDPIGPEEAELPSGWRLPPQKPAAVERSAADEPPTQPIHLTAKERAMARWEAAQTQPIPAKPKAEAEPPSDIERTQVHPVKKDDASTTSPVGVTRQGVTLPRHVSEVDRYATRVTPAAYTGVPYPQKAKDGKTATGHTQPVKVKAKSKRKMTGCLVRGLIAMLFIGVLALVGFGSFVVYKYYTIAASLPDVSDLSSKASQFETTRILDRNGNLLYEILDPNAGRRTYVKLEDISPYLIAATLATEDKEYYNHGGWDPIAVARAFWQNYTSGEIVSGASTITQQLARMLLMDSEERYEVSYERKIREIVLASEITRLYSKDEILELYLNEINYSNLAYGVEAAAETYFNTTADKLTLAQASFLAGLPQAPSVYDIFANRDITLQRHKQVLVLMYQASQEDGCIYVSTSAQKVCVDETAAADAATEIENYNFQVTTGDMKYPHWVNYIRSLLEEQYDPQTIYRSGFTVYTTLDPELQDQAEQILSAHVAELADRNVTDGSLVAIQPNTGEILAMVGSADFYNDAISGQVNMALSPRQPGSSIKPITYVAAFEKGWTASTLIWDVPSEFSPSGDPNDQSDKYVPVNYDGKFHGPVTVRTALSNSFNIPAVKALQFVGIYDNPDTSATDGFIAMANRLGITTLTQDGDYGLSLTLGGGEVSLLELTGAYSVFANEGRKIDPVAITKIVDHTGNVVYQYEPPSGEQVIRAEHAYIISSILSDNEARTPTFGSNSVLNLPFQAAVKTGTTNDFRDNLTVGYTPDLVVGVWVGNADWTPMVNTTGLTGAAPIWSDFMKVAIDKLTGGNPTPFSRPAGIVDRVVCSVSGTEPSEWCPSQRTEIYAADQLPETKENDLWQKAKIDTWTGLAASADCSEYTTEKFAIDTNGDAFASKWVVENDQGRSWAESVGFTEPLFVLPTTACTSSDPHPTLKFTNLTEGQTITTAPLDIYAIISATDQFSHYRLEYGVGDNPSEFKVLLNDSTTPIPESERIYTWDLKDIPAGTITLRLYLEHTDYTYAEKKIHINIQVPTPTMTPTATATSTPTPTNTPTATSTPTPTPTPTNTASTSPSQQAPLPAQGTTEPASG